LNLFVTASEDDQVIRQQQFNTRIYLIAFTSVLGILLFYTATRQQIFTKTYLSPTLDQYELLESRYEGRLQCPCQEIAIAYGEFIEKLAVDRYHQVCVSKVMGLVFYWGNT
jgi:hypothetical protein